MRLFIALPLPKEIEESLGELIFALKQKGRDVKWVAPKNIHMTAKFLGEVGEDKLDKIKQSLTVVAGKHSAVKSNIDQLGAFPNMSRPRVIWVGLQEGIGQLAAITEDVEAKMVLLGFPREEKKFSPHITLGRVRDGGQTGELVNLIKSYQLKPMELVFNSLVLFKSTLTPQGPIYTCLSSARFGEK